MKKAAKQQFRCLFVAEKVIPLRQFTTLAFNGSIHYTLDGKSCGCGGMDLLCTRSYLGSGSEHNGQFWY